MALKNYILHTRPLSFFFVGFHFTVGFLFSGLFDPLAFAVSLFTWVVLLNGGTLAFNTSYDQDDGNIGLLKNPPAKPERLLLFSLILLIGGLALSLFISRTYLFFYALCFALSIAYSAPPLRLKGRFGFDILTNMLGYGAFTFLAGYHAMAPLPTARSYLTALGFALLFGALYPTTQVYQYDNDKRNKDMTFAVFLGPRKALKLGVLLALGAHAAFLAGAPGGPIQAGLLLSAAAWPAVFLLWLRGFATANHERNMYVALGCWLLTEGIVAAGLAF